MADALSQLELYSCISSVSTELCNHVDGLSSDVNGARELGEMVIGLYEEANGALSAFTNKLQEVGGDEFSSTLITNLHRLIGTMHPKYRTGSSKAGAPAADKSKISVLAMPDGMKWKSVEELVEEEQREKAAKMAAEGHQSNGKGKNPMSQGVDDLMSQLESVGEKRRAPASSERRNIDLSPPRMGSNGRGQNGRDSYDERSRNGAASGSGRPRLDDKPQLYKIYDGKITGMRDFGAFVALEGLASRAEGEHKQRRTVMLSS